MSRDSGICTRSSSTLNFSADHSKRTRRVSQKRRIKTKKGDKCSAVTSLEEHKGAPRGSGRCNWAVMGDGSGSSSLTSPGDAAEASGQCSRNHLQGAAAADELASWFPTNEQDRGRGRDCRSTSSTDLFAL